MVDLEKKEKNNNIQAIKLKKVANISYEEAVYVLSKNDGDLLDSLSFLQKSGRIRNSKVLYFNTKDYNARNNTKSQNFCNKKNSQSSQKIAQGINSIFDKGSRNYFEVHRLDMDTIKIPLTVFIVLLFIAFGIVVPLIIVGMFFDITYKFNGRDINENDSINVFFNRCFNNIQEYKNKRRGHKK